VPRTIAVIPARLGSTRFPGKLLTPLSGRPLLWHVWSRTCSAASLGEVLIATDAEEIAAAARSWGAEVRMTPADCQSGSQRIATLIPGLEADWILNVQGDEPLIEPQLLDALVAAAEQSPADILTPVFRIRQQQRLEDPNLVKAAVTSGGRALYFSRHPVPYLRDEPREHWAKRHDFLGHVGVYLYRREVLARYGEIPASGLETAEQLEQLRFLAAGYRIDAVLTDYHPLGVDTPEDLAEAERELARREPS